MRGPKLDSLGLSLWFIQACPIFEFWRLSAPLLSFGIWMTDMHTTALLFRLAYACLTGLLSQACLDAHASVVLWSSWSDFFSNSVLLFLLVRA